MLLRAVVVGSMFAAATAHAQAPGEMSPELAPPGWAPVQPAANPCGGCDGSTHESVMANRWAIGVGFGSLGIAPKDQPDYASKFGLATLSLRYRATLHLEIELALDGGREQLPNGVTGDRTVSAGVVGLRYRFAPERPWNWWLAGGLGGISITSQNATDQERQDAQRPMMQVGIGLERRFHRFAIDAELRALAVGPDQHDQTQPVKGTVMLGTETPGSTTTPPPPPPTVMSPSQAQSGGQLTIGASFYF